MFKLNKRSIFLSLGIIILLIVAFFANAPSDKANVQHQAIIESLTTLSLTTESSTDAPTSAQIKSEATQQTSAEPTASLQTTETTERIETSLVTETMQQTSVSTEDAIETTTKAASTSSSERSTMVINPDTGKDKYLTDPVPDGEPLPFEWQETKIDTSVVYYCSLAVDCKTILNNLDSFNQDKLSVLPQDGVILSTTSVPFYKGESVFNVLQREMKRQGIHLEFNMTPAYNSVYIEGINNLYEFYAGDLSGWMYRVNGWYPNYGASRYQLKDGDVIEWLYTCDLGRDIGGSLNLPKE